jgi:hypothetical protein
MTIAVCLLTCDRYEYTAATVSSFVKCNDVSRFLLLHADDASEDPRIAPLVQSYGFTTVIQHKARRGWLRTRTRLLSYAAKRASWILNMENDIETVRPFPWKLFRFVARRPDVSSLRLYGMYKDRDRLDACLTRSKVSGLEVDWRPFRDAPEKSQIGLIHWSAQPSVTRASEVLDHHLYGSPLSGWTVRVKKNVCFHIGTERTPPLEVAC